MIFRTTLDIDSTDKDFIVYILKKIFSCKFCIDLCFYDSSFKGIHIIIFCLKKCEICRFVFDDFRRFAYDSNRPEYARNILFQEKEIIKLKV